VKAGPRVGTAVGAPGSPAGTLAGVTVANQPELDRLEAIATDGLYNAGPMPASLKYLAGIFRRHWRGRRCLELGPAEGLVTEELVGAFPELTVVDGSSTFCRELSARFPGVAVVNALFEEYTPPHRFDTVVLGHVLEHVLDPVALLERIRAWVAPGGVLLATVPNALSLHRQAAVLMGLLPAENALNETDHHYGHRRVYDLAGLRADFASAGWTVTTTGGYWLKPVSNAQIAEQWTPQMLAAFLAMGERYPDSAAEIYVVAEP
jgi:2-polyprenyl-3-methyl-5-hydroxy-6-metoxy-1,4-benzoquinol methylase